MNEPFNLFHAGLLALPQLESNWAREPRQLMLNSVLKRRFPRLAM
jgi:hypothetical protein